MLFDLITASATYYDDLNEPISRSNIKSMRLLHGLLHISPTSSSCLQMFLTKPAIRVVALFLHLVPANECRKVELINMDGIRLVDVLGEAKQYERCGDGHYGSCRHVRSCRVLFPEECFLAWMSRTRARTWQQGRKREGRKRKDGAIAWTVCRDFKPTRSLCWGQVQMLTYRWSTKWSGVEA
jgi:hypothetical protein